MLQVAIESSNYYYEMGLRNLLNKVMSQEEGDRAFLPDFILQGENRQYPDIIFRDFMVTINFYDKVPQYGRYCTVHSVRSIHIPFICKEYDFDELAIKVRKIISIAGIGNHSPLERKVIYKAAGVKRHMQLSTAESNIMLLIGEGKDAKNISRLLRRSERTIGTHCRNAIKKMGMDNRLEFYKYASCLARFGRKGEITICL